MAFLRAFAVFTTIHFLIRGSFIIFTATWEFIIHIHARFKSGIIVSHFGYFLLDLSRIRGGALISNGELFSIGIPFGIGGPGFFSCFFYAGLAHTAITGHLEGLCF
jgi:hypothetical protein